MATKNNKVVSETAESTEVVTNPWKQTRAITYPRLSGKNQPDVIASCNGRVYKIQRGVEVNVPLPIYEVLKNSLKAEEAAEDYYYNKASASD